VKPEEIESDSGPIDLSALDDFEVKFGIKLPGSYRVLMESHNALYPKKSHFRFENKFHNELWSYRLEADGTDSRDITFFGFGENLPDYECIDWRQGFDVYGHDYVIAFGTASNGDHICFDYRHNPKTCEPHVVVMFHDAFDELRKMAISHVADSFDGFMSMLYSGGGKNWRSGGTCQSH
jgi:hypothetical protein